MTDHDAIAARVRQDREAGALFSGPVYIKLTDMADAYLDLYDEVKRLRDTLGWYSEQARLCRLIHSDGDTGRHALADDGGRRARAALKGDTK